MKKNRVHLFLILAVVLVFFTVAAVRADIAPPQLPSGANLQPGETEARTLVRMASENVLITVEKATAPLEGMETFTSSDMRARVEAEFVMHNYGNDDEAFEVWFPLGENSGYASVIELEDFHAWVDGQEVKIEAKQSPGRISAEKIPWAAWRVKFPSGKDVHVRVAYIMRPTGYRPYGTFSYILETGAGWNGKIGEGTVTLRLPYLVDKFNTAMNANTDEAPNPLNYEVSGTDVVWHFVDLEPSEADNIRLTILTPQTWEAIQQAQDNAKGDPSSSTAALHLAAALEDALQFKYGLMKIGDSEAILRSADEAYRRAIALDPRNGQGYKLYANFLEKQSMYWMGNKEDPILARLLPTLAHALALNPGDVDLQEMQTRIEGEGIHIPTAVPLQLAEASLEAPAEVSPSPSLDVQRPTPPESTSQEPTQTQKVVSSPTPAGKSTLPLTCPGGAAAVFIFLGVWVFSRKNIDCHR